MRIVERVSKEAQNDHVWEPYLTEALCWRDWDSDSEIWAFCLLAPFVALWYYLDNANWAGRWFPGKRPPENFKLDFLKMAVEHTERERMSHSVAPYVRDLQAYEDALKQKPPTES